MSDTRRELAIQLPRLADPRRRDQLARMARLVDEANGRAGRLVDPYVESPRVSRSDAR